MADDTVVARRFVAESETESAERRTHAFYIKLAIPDLMQSF